MNNTVVHTTWKINKLAELQNEGVIYLDLRFQSSFRWSTKAMLAYLKSVFEGFTPNPIILADVESCMKYCENTLGKDSEDYEYFAGLYAQGVKYISVDGNNRCRTLMKFLKNKLKLKAGDCYRMSGVSEDKLSLYTPPNAQQFVGMPEKLKDYIKNIDIPVVVTNKASRQDLHNMFVSVNNGVPLNPQEKRNALVCKLADEIRALAKKYEEMFALYFTDTKRQRRQHEEFLVSAAVHIANGINDTISAKHRDEAYRVSSIEEKKISKLKKVIADMDGLCVYESKTGKKRGIPSQASFFDLMMLIDYLRNQNISIIDKSSFFEWFVKNINLLRNDKRTIVVPDVRDPRTYYGAQRAMDKKFREVRLAQLVARLVSLPDGVLSVPKDKKRFGDDRDRITLWTNQEHRCPLTGKDIPWVEVLDGDKTHLDHIVPHSKGGKTTTENLQLVKKDANLLKSNN